MTEILARALGASRRYGDVVALHNVDLNVPAGSMIGLLGPNGAGKSTLLNLLVGLRRPTSGSVELFGGSPLDAGRRQGLGMTPQQTGLPPTLRVREVIDFVAAHYPDPMPVADVLARFGLTEKARKQTGALSGGQQRRLAVALAFVGRPRLVVLDEPTTGLDVGARRTLWSAIREFHAGGGTVLLTSHYLEEIEALAQRVVVLGGGRVLADGSVADIRGQLARSSISFRAGPEQRFDPSHLPGVAAHHRDGERHVLQTADADQLVRRLVADAVPFEDLEVRPASLEEAFLALTTSETAGASR